MTPLDLLRTDGGMALAGALVLVGWVTGAAFIVTVYWRRLTHPIDGALLTLRRDYDDAMERLGEAVRQVSEQQRVIDAQTQQIGQLYRDVDRMARIAIDAAAKARALGAA